MFLRLVLILVLRATVYCDTVPDQLIVNSTSNVQITLTQPLYIKTIVFSDPQAQLSLYAGPTAFISQQTLLRKYSAGNSISSLPQEIIAPSISMQLSSGTALVESTRNASLCTWATPRVGRSGFLMTPDYPFIANQAYIPVVNFIAPAGTPNIQYDFSLVGGTSGVYTASIVYNGIESYYNNVLTEKSPGHTLRLVGTHVSVDYRNSNKSTGILVEFTMSDYQANRQTTAKPTKGSAGLSAAIGILFLAVIS